ncbi:MAG: hypothetical protein ACE5FL_06610 [Myxococcota bacterium]
MNASPAIPRTCPDSVLFAGIFLIAFATLLIEVSIIRVLSFTVWHHFGYVVISTALLGFGASGTLLAVVPSIGAADLRTTLTRLSIASSVSAIGALLLIQQVPLHPMSVLEEPAQMGVAVAYLIGTAIPFFFSGLVISLGLRGASDRVDRLYFWDLVGAGLGCGSAVAIMNYVTPPGSVFVAGAVFALAALVFSCGGAARVVAATLAGALALGSFHADKLPFTAARSKHLAVMMKTLLMEPREEVWTALFRTDLIEDVKADTRCGGPGASVSAPKTGCERPRYWIAHDASAGAPIYDMEGLPYQKGLDYYIVRTPYLISNPDPSVLIIGVGGGRDIVVARQYGASHVTGLELDPVALKWLHDDLDATHEFFSSPEIELVAGEGRHYARTTDRKFDVIQITGVDTLAAEYSGSYVLAENYLYTVESFHEYLDHLSPGGILSIATGNLSPDAPRAAGRILSIAHRALEERGIADPAKHIAVLDSATLLVSTLIRLEPFTRAETAKLADYAAEYDFRVLHLPGERGGNPVIEALVRATSNEREQLEAKLPHLVHATTDDRPFFFTFFRWTELFGPDGVTPSHSTALGQIILGMLVIALTVLGAIFILGPLAAFNRRGVLRPGSLGVLGYFVSLGLGFMLFEISLIQKFVLFLGYPTYSLTVTLFSLLLFLGCGSFFSARWVGRERVVLPLAVVAIGALALFYARGLPIIQDGLLGAPIAVRVLVTVLVLMPLGLVLGMFFPLGIRRAAAIHDDLVPWAWAINGCASVTGGVVTIALAMSFGFTKVWALSVVIYALGVAAFLTSTRRSTASV